MKKVLLYLLCLCASSCISRMRRPILEGQVLDYHGKPLAHCQVGEGFTDEQGCFRLAEKRYSAFLLTEIMMFEAPPVRVFEPVKKEGYEPDYLKGFNPFGGGARKGTVWEAGTIYLKRINETLPVSQLIENKTWEVLVSVDKQEIIAVLADKTQMHTMSQRVGNQYSLFLEKRRDSLYEKADGSCDTFDLWMKEGGMQITPKQCGSTTPEEKTYHGKYTLEADSILRIQTDFEVLNGVYRLTETDRSFFMLKAVKNN